jgi:hypothetical protein
VLVTETPAPRRLPSMRPISRPLPATASTWCATTWRIRARNVS